MPSLFYNLFIIKNGKVLEKTAINKQIAHGMKSFKAEAGQKYIAYVVNWADTSVVSDLTLTTYSEKAFSYLV